MLFSVVIPTYNRALLLQQALRSVYAQSFTDYEVIVVDDGSTDTTGAELERLGKNIRVFHQQNAGPGAARNLGARHAVGEYLAFLDSDDLWFPWTLMTFANLISKHHAPAILSAHIHEFEHQTDLGQVTETPLKMEAFTDYLASSQKGYYVGAGMAVLRRKEYTTIGGFKNRRINCEDHDLTLRMGDAFGFVQITSPVTLAYRRHVTSTTNNLLLTIKGSLYMVGQERRGLYPGGVARALDRRRILTRHVRPVTVECLKRGLRNDAWQLYRATFRWHIDLGRWNYLLGFPLKALLTTG